MFPGCIVMKTDPTYMQGIPDLLILLEDRWFALEVKKSKKAHHQPNQDFYVKRMNTMSYASFISPETEEEILNDIQQSFGSRRKARIPKRKSV